MKLDFFYSTEKSVKSVIYIKTLILLVYLKSNINRAYFTTPGKCFSRTVPMRDIGCYRIIQLVLNSVCK